MLIGIDASRAGRARRTGTERYSLEIIRHLLALPAAGHHRWRLYSDAAPPTSLFALPGQSQAPYELCVLPARRGWTHRALADEIAARPPDVLFVPAHVLPFVLPPRRLPPSVVTVHDLGHRRFPAAHTAAQRLYLELTARWHVRAATRLLCVSRATAADLAALYGAPAGKLAVAYEAAAPCPPADAAHIHQAALRHGLTRPYALYIGTIQPRKNLARLVGAYARLYTQGDPGWDLALAGGSGWGSEPLHEIARWLNVAERVRFLGYVPDEELYPLLRGALFFAFPSLYEGFGLPVLEAQSCGVPVMTANNSSLPEVAGDAALLVEPTDIDAIADAMLRLSRDEELRQRLIAAGHRNVQRFSWSKAAAETLAVLEEAARSGKRGG